jgi:hypothetical protein
MIVFAVIALAPNPALEAAIAAKYPDSHLKIGPNSWLVAGSGTAEETSRRLGVYGGSDIGMTVVFSTAGYFGRAPSNVWEWIKAKMEAPSNG